VLATQRLRGARVLHKGATQWLSAWRVPQKHPRTGVYWFRRRVPERLRALVGKTEEVRSLKTKDLNIAKARHIAVAAEVEERWKNLQRGPAVLTHQQVLSLAGEVYRAEVEAHQADPGDPRQWVAAEFFDRWIARTRRTQSKKPDGIRLTTGWSPAETLVDKRYGERADALLARHGLQIRPEDRKRIVLAAADAMHDAHGQLRRNAEGDYRLDPQAARFPPPQRFGPPLTLQALWEDFKEQKQVSLNTEKAWAAILRKLEAFVGVMDVRDIPEDHLVRWRDHLLKSATDSRTGKRLQPKRVRDSYIAAARAVFSWACDQRKMTVNPAEKIKVTVPIKPKLRSKGFTDDEARRILSAALALPNRLITPEHAAARRWVPWLCAYTGARVNEITQLRRKDVLEDTIVHKEDGREVEKTYYFIRITPEAGNQKSRTFREVPLHDHLMEQGFIEFVKRCEQGPLFYSTKRQKQGVSGQNPTYARVGQSIAVWVRGLGIKDPFIQPNHAWRHRFKTLGRLHGMDSAKLDAIQGHAQANEGGSYGEFPAASLKPEIDKLPRYEVVAAETTDRRKTRHSKDRANNPSSEAPEGAV
jgi:integrase